MKLRNKNQNHKEKDLKLSKIKRFGRAKKQPKNQAKAKDLSSAFRVFMDSLSVLRQHWKLFGGIAVVYFLANLLLVGGAQSGYDLDDLRTTMTSEFGELATSLALFGMLLGSAGGSGSESGSVFQVIVVLIVSLATIWALREVFAGNKIGIRDAFYKGMLPLVPFILVLLFLCLVLIPGAIAAFVMNTVIGGGLAVILWEQLLWIALVVGLLFVSLRWVTRYIFAIYVVTLPDMRPVAAIKASRKLVAPNMWAVMRKLLFLPFMFLVISIVVFLPMIMVSPLIAQWFFVISSTLALVFVHIYLYSLYKELL